MVQEHLEDTDLGSYPEIRKPLWKSRFTEEKFQHYIRTNIYKFGCIEMGKRDFTCVICSPKAAAPLRAK